VQLRTASLTGRAASRGDRDPCSRHGHEACNAGMLTRRTGPPGTGLRLRQWLAPSGRRSDAWPGSCLRGWPR
jgi:hypothetical protein